MRRLVFISALLAARAAAAPERHNMSSQGFLQLSDDAFWAPPVDLQPYVRERMLSGAEGLALDAPRGVDVRARATLPAAIISIVSAKMALDWSYRDNLLIVACEVERFHCLADQAAPIERPVLRTPRTGGGSAGQGHVGNKALIDVRRRVQLPWEPGIWQLLLVTREQRSEPARVVLHSGGKIPPTPAPVPGAQLKVTASGKGLDTTLDLAVKARASRAALQAGQGGDDVAVPVTFVVTGHAQPIPYVVRRAVPGHWGPAGEPEHVVASTRVALKDLVPEGVEDSALYVWAFAGDQVSTPVRVAMP